MFSWLARARGRRSLAVLLVVAAVLLGASVSPASAQGDKRVVKVMTYNMDAGTDFLYFLYGDSLETAFQQTYLELLASGFPARAAALAGVLAVEKPYLVSLQEVTLWEFLDGEGTSQQVVADQLSLLKAAIKAERLPYKVLAVQNLTNLYLPLGPQIFHFLDRNVVLVRTDLAQAELATSDVQMAAFANTSEPIPGFVQVNGWISVDAKIRGKNLRFFATHLASSSYPGDPLQPAQGTELITVMNRSPFPVILAGDFNSDLSTLNLYPFDVTTTAPAIIAAGYQDAWTAAGHQPWEGLTWPLYWEDILVGSPAGPVERIDLVFAKGFEVLEANTVGTAPVYPSDHAGVVATLMIDK